MAGQKEVNQLIAEAPRQGWTVVPIKNGYMLRSPDGETAVTVHRSTSDVKAWRNALAKMRRGGFVWPPPKRK